MKKDLIPIIGFGILAAFFVAMLVLHKPKGAGTDSWCLNNCTQRGFEEDYCQTRCSYDPEVQRKAGGNTADPRCLKSCLSSGQSSAFCTKTCSYY